MSTKTALSLSGLFNGLNNPIVLALGLTQTIGYGTLYYSYGVLAPAISKEFGIGVDWFFGAFTLGLLLGGLVAPQVGKTLDQKGARIVLAIGSLCASSALVACSISPNVWAFSAAIIIMVAAACLVLYAAAFAGLTQIYREKARQAITLITLIAGFASTIFWPLTQWMLESFGWRSTFIIFAVSHLLICAPLHWYVLRGAMPVQRTDKTAQAFPVSILEGALRQRAILFYAIAIVVSGLVYSAVPVHMLRIIENEGFTAQAAALIAMFMGPAQVISRLIEALGGNKFDPLMTGRVALGALTSSLVILLALPGSAATAILFALTYGIAQGLITIARGTVPLQLFGVKGYATLVGRITGIRFLANAFSPFLFALAMTHLSIDFALTVCGRSYYSICFFLKTESAGRDVKCREC